MGEYKKPWLTFEEQADLLIVERGLVGGRSPILVGLYWRGDGWL